MLSRIGSSVAAVTGVFLSFLSTRDVAAAESGWTNPFASEVEAPPGRLSVALHGGSIHGDGAGLDLGVTALRWVEAKVAYGYRNEHSFVGYLKGTLLPTAMLSPYMIAGYGYGLTKLRGGIALHTQRLVAGLGLQAHVSDRYFLGAEVATAYGVSYLLVERSRDFDVEVNDPWSVSFGFAVGAWLF